MRLPLHDRLSHRTARNPGRERSQSLRARCGMKSVLLRCDHRQTDLDTRVQKGLRYKTPLWGFAGHPLLDGRKLVCLVGGEGIVAVVFDADAGKELWRALSAKKPGYAPPMICESGGKHQLILWHPDSINSLDLETGQRITDRHCVRAKFVLVASSLCESEH